MAEAQKRQKTFTGCWTCRSRKVKCDLRKPHCLRCEKAGFHCTGYDIKLRWSPPVLFDKYGTQLSSPHTLGNLIKDEQYFQRRNVEFVRYKKEYETYDEMDRHLLILHNDQTLSSGQVKLLGPYGVFRGIENLKKRKHFVPRLKSSKKSKPSSPSVASSSPPPPPPPSNLAIQQHPDMNFYNSAPNLAQGNEWLSKDLIDDALLTVSALNGDTHFLDFFNVNDPIKPLPLQTDSPELLKQQNQDEMFNLLFHRNSQFDKQFPSLNTTPQQQQQPRFKLNSNNELQPIEDIEAPQEDFSNTISIHAPDLSSKMPSDIMEVVTTTNPLPKTLQIDDIPIQSTSLYVHPMTRYLLNYYIEQVADMMTVIPLPKNPWKFIYFPRLIMAVGELGSVGKTSNAKNCLLNALLLVSAFNLQSKFERNSQEMKYYLNLGIQLRQQATIFLKNCLLDDVLQQKYKDVLVAVLSMVTVDMVWGTMSDCKLHLDICEKFISKKMEIKKKLSSKLLILHRIFSNLKLIQDSTSLNNIKKEEIYLNNENYKDFLIDEKTQEEYKSPQNTVTNKGVFHEKLNDQGKIKIEFIVNSEDEEEEEVPKKKSSIPLFIDITRTSFKVSKNKLNDDLISSDAIYGLPNSLILLFSEIVHLVRFKKYHDDNNLKIPRFFHNLTKEIDLKLQNWTLEWKLYETTEDDEKRFLTKRHEGIYHHVLSFYHGLVIYFQRQINLVNPLYLQDHVEKVLIHLNLIQQITESKTTKEFLIIPLFWQGFIAGSEAMTYFLQNGFKDWGTKISQSGIGSYWVARQIMLEVWRRKNTNEKRNSWCDVIKDWEMNVMLS